MTKYAALLALLAVAAVGCKPKEPVAPEQPPVATQQPAPSGGGIAPIGSEANHILRVEAGYISTGHEVDGTADVFEIGRAHV